MGKIVERYNKKGELAYLANKPTPKPEVTDVRETGQDEHKRPVYNMKINGIEYFAVECDQD